MERYSVSFGKPARTHPGVMKMPRLMAVLGALLLAALIAVPVALAQEGEHEQDETPWVGIERIGEEAKELIERFRGFFGGNAGITILPRPFDSGTDSFDEGFFDGFSTKTLQRIAIAVGPVESVTDSSITVDRKTFRINDGTRIPPDLEAGAIVLVRGEWVDGEQVARSVTSLGLPEQFREAFPRRASPWDTFNREWDSFPWELIPQGSIPWRSFSGSFGVYGEVERITDSSITVGGEEIAFTEDTRMPDDLEVGDIVTVIGSLREGGDGERVAQAVHRGRLVERPRAAFGNLVDDERFRLSGEVESVILGSGYVKLDLGDHVVRIAPHEVDHYMQNGQPVVGALVIVSGTVAENGDLLARSVTVVNK